MKYYIKHLIIIAVIFVSYPINSLNYNSLRWYDEYYSNRIANDGENLWVTTSTGLIKYNKRQFVRRLFPKRMGFKKN